MMERWASGDFDSDWIGPPDAIEFDDLALKKQPSALDEAALRACIGGPFYPGIESTHLMANATTYEAPYRVDRLKPPGFLTELMAVPWQADYVECGALWWPAQRPVSVKTDNGTFDSFTRKATGHMNYADMVRYWQELGFIIQAPHGEYVETERGVIP